MHLTIMQIANHCKAADTTVNKVIVLGCLYENIIIQILTPNVQLKKAQWICHKQLL